jgi:hypothetical protein
MASLLTHRNLSANSSFGAQMLPSSTPRKIIELKKPAAHIKADIEYRIVWNEISANWEIHRNGTKTGASRRKRQSAIDMAILAIQSEESRPDAKAIVTLLKGGTLKTEWVTKSNAQAAPDEERR